MMGFSPVTVKESPVASSTGKNLTGNPRIARDIIADVYNTLQKWNDINIEGCKIVKEIAIIKGNNSKNYSDELEILTRELSKLVQKCSLVLEEISIYYDRMLALKKLDKEESPLFMSLSVDRMTKMIQVIQEAYLNELKNKRKVVENIAHSDCDNVAIFFAALWTYQIDLTSEVTTYLEALLTESGHRKIV
ncbi:hypothetical protein WA026_018006 [Henosepilachna vigintioctopunctata]|uniref:Cyclin-dependent kinase 2-interacting protein n=1 Tax=Henosepilachna vigintioctopunctata TaxID=420089 RepID=A0AAW1TW28_9CUCU